MYKLTTRPGATRSYRRVLSEDGFFLVCAMDHLEDFDYLLGGPSVERDRRVVAEKARLIAAVAPLASAVLLDPVAGIPAANFSGALPAAVGIIASLEEENYEFPDGARETFLRDKWDVQKAKAAGADMAKLLWFYRPDLDAGVAARQRELVRMLCQDAVTAGLSVVVEPIWNAVHGEDSSTDQWRTKRNEGIIAAALEVAELGADLVKVEFPGSVDTEQEQTAARLRCERLTEGLNVPWVLLSAGVPLAEFEVQLEIAAKAGAAGYMAGRSLWHDAVGDSSKDHLVVSRIERLNAIVRAHGRPALPSVTLEDAVALPLRWYENGIG